MINKKAMNLFGLAMIFWTALFAESVSAQATNGAKPVLTFDALAGNSLNGAWKLNQAESDNVFEKARKLFQPANEKTAVAGKQSAGQTESPALSISLFPPETLVLASGDGDAEMTINESFTNVVLTRTVTTDGKTRLYLLNAGVHYSVAAIGKGNRLTIETNSPRGNKMTEIYELVEGKLKVTVQIKDSAAQEILTLHRVYDRTILDIFTGDAAEIQ